MHAGGYLESRFHSAPKENSSKSKDALQNMSVSSNEKRFTGAFQSIPTHLPCPQHMFGLKWAQTLAEPSFRVDCGGSVNGP